MPQRVDCSPTRFHSAERAGSSRLRSAASNDTNSWIGRGVRRLVPTPDTNIRRTLHGAVNLATGAFRYHVSHRTCRWCSATSSNNLDAYPAAPVVAVVCDNGGTHHSGITRDWLTDHPRLLLIEAARYSPHDNPVERIWVVLKTWTANSAPQTIASRVRRAYTFFRHRTLKFWPPPRPGPAPGSPTVTDKTLENLLRVNSHGAVAGPEGRASLADLFAGRVQPIGYHFT